MRPPARRLSTLFLLGLMALALPSSAEEESGTKFWFGVRAGGGFFAKTDPDQIEALSTSLSSPIAGQRIEFDRKGWEVPFGARLGFQFRDWIRVFGLFERLPYILERDPSDTGSLIPPTESVRLSLGANVLGGGVDFVLADAAYGQSLIFGISGGYLWAEGSDRDVLFNRNFSVKGTGTYFELSLAGEYEFNDEVTFLPFVAVRVAKATDTSFSLSRILDRQTTPEPFEIDYTGVTIGIEGRFQLWPWGESDDSRGRELPGGGHWEN